MLKERELRLVLCPACDSELSVPIEEEEIFCECGERVEVFEEGYPEEFVWHPGKKF
ncbi:MAG: hypothetical protein GXO63_03000 [Candidatus Micrarchaeota archaeon]|nr:hypothetical protein [Candidatus Micrarchaeota archaeon]